MAKIQKVDLNLGQKIVNPFKTTRKSSTNPFKYQDFEGNTLDLSVCADVFESSASKTSKLKMISSSVIGSITKLHNSITEPIINFVKRIGTGISSAWDYAKNTNVSDLAGIKIISDTLNKDIVDIGKDLTSSISGIGKQISSKMSFLNTDISDIGKGITSRISLHNSETTELGHGIADKWLALIQKIHPSRINKDTSVAELKSMWEHEIELSKKEVA